ncbi:hypothetical protein FW774_14295 [Pedobacter sp. BS3]|uniref:hypothetical protein n=1 Tax=Pedobacter sp. BS3 TaxID=2567937 RepID=UPI0011EC072F|nr:hypothetical protein [Pedobacter sp. BS3]TZF82669.1 hypothetical protein FW774_14295 [Pedobacter sp. BS3]
MKHSSLIIAMLITFTAFAQTKTNHPAQLSASEIISKSEEAYKNLKFYLDSGKVISDHSDSKFPNKSVIYFKTAYSNTGNFNFEFYAPGKSNSLYVINRTGNDIKSWWGVTNKIKSHTKITEPLNAAAGVSHLSSRMIPLLLLKEPFTSTKNIYQSLDSVAVTTEALNGLACYKLSGVSNGGKATIWISEKDFLIRKITMINVISESQAQMLNQLALSKTKDKNPRAYQILKNYKATGRTLKKAYEFYPYTPKTIDKALFTFRPNRKVPL